MIMDAKNEPHTFNISNMFFTRLYWNDRVVNMVLNSKDQISLEKYD